MRFTELPSDLVRIAVCENVDIIGMVLLDSAITNKNFRLEWISSIRNFADPKFMHRVIWERKIFHSTKSSECHSACLKWLLFRNIPVTDLHIDAASSTMREVMNILKHPTDTTLTYWRNFNRLCVTSVFIAGCDGPTIKEIFELLPSITGLTLLNTCSSHLCPDDFNRYVPDVTAQNLTFVRLVTVGKARIMQNNLKLFQLFLDNCFNGCQMEFEVKQHQSLMPGLIGMNAHWLKGKNPDAVVSCGVDMRSNFCMVTLVRNSSCSNNQHQHIMQETVSLRRSNLSPTEGHATYHRPTLWYDHHSDKTQNFAVLSMDASVRFERDRPHSELDPWDSSIPVLSCYISADQDCECSSRKNLLQNNSVVCQQHISNHV